MQQPQPCFVCIYFQMVSWEWQKNPEILPLKMAPVWAVIPNDKTDCYVQKLFTHNFFQKPSCLKPERSTKLFVTTEKAVLLFEVTLVRIGEAGIAAPSSEEALQGQKRKTVMCTQGARGESLSLALPGMMAGDEDSCILKSFCLPDWSEAGNPH